MLQASTKSEVVPAAVNHRLGWSHYARQPGVIEVIGQCDPGDLARGYITDSLSPKTSLDLGSVSARLIDKVQMCPGLDRTTSVRTRTTHVRWVARPAELANPVARVKIEGDVLRTIEINMPADQTDLVHRFCEDFALHDWLLTSISQIIEQADRAVAKGREPLKVLKPAVERLPHLWMPGAHVDRVLHPLWDALELKPGYSQSWHAKVTRIRDHIALATLQTLEFLEHTKRTGDEW